MLLLPVKIHKRGFVNTKQFLSIMSLQAVSFPKPLQHNQGSAVTTIVVP